MADFFKVIISRSSDLGTTDTVFSMYRNIFGSVPLSSPCSVCSTDPLLLVQFLNLVNSTSRAMAEDHAYFEYG